MGATQILKPVKPNVICLCANPLQGYVKTSHCPSGRSR